MNDAPRLDVRPGSVLLALIAAVGIAAWRSAVTAPNVARVSVNAPARLVQIAMLDVFKKRHAVRAYQRRPVSDADLNDILAAASSAPSAGGLKAREIRMVTDQAVRQRLARAAHDQEFVAEAPVVLVFWAVPSRSAAKYGERGSDLFALQDATIAASFAWLQAVASGLGACWVGAFDDDAVNDVFRGSIGRDWRPIALLPVGYSAEPR